MGVKILVKVTSNFFLILPHGMSALQQFIQHLRTVHPTIKFAIEISLQKMPFLDLLIYIKDGQLHNRLYTKATGRNICLSFYSEHPPSLKKSMPFPQFLKTK